MVQNNADDDDEILPMMGEIACVLMVSEVIQYIVHPMHMDRGVYVYLHT